MRNISKLAIRLTPLCFALAACSGPASNEAPSAPQYAAHFYGLDDVSGSSAVQGDDVVGKAVRARIGEAVKAMSLGDSATIIEVGSLSAERFVAHPTITTNAQKRQATAAREVVAQLEEIAAKHRASGGDGGTHLTMALANLQPDCRSGRSVIKIISDGLESSEAFDAGAALATGKPITLPRPTTAYLRGCRVEFIGFGVVADGSGSGGQLLPARALEALRQGWLDYLRAAGASDIKFTSLL